MSSIPPAQDWKLHDIEVALRDAFPHFQNDEPITAEAIERIGKYFSAGSDSPSELAKADLKQVLDFLNSIEGAGYGGMAEFEIARETMRRASLVPSAEQKTE